MNTHTSILYLQFALYLRLGYPWNKGAVNGKQFWGKVLPGSPGREAGNRGRKEEANHCDGPGQPPWAHDSTSSKLPRSESSARLSHQTLGEGCSQERCLPGASSLQVGTLSRRRKALGRTSASVTGSSTVLLRRDHCSVVWEDPEDVCPSGFIILGGKWRSLGGLKSTVTVF